MTTIAKAQQNKKIDSLYIFFGIFIFFILVTSFYLVKIDANMNKYLKNSNMLTELKVIDKKFDTFLYQEVSFVNYDLINNDIHKFEKNIEYLDSEGYAKYTKIIKNKFDKKVYILENYKSTSALLLNSMHYLFDLDTAISSSKVLESKTIHKAEKTFLLVMKYYINPYIDTSLIQTNLQDLEKYNKLSLDLDMFIQHSKVNIKEIKRFSNIQNELLYLDLYDSIEEFDVFLYNDYKSELIIKRAILLVIFILILMLIVILLQMQRKSLKLRDNLISFSTAIENSYNSIVITDTDSNITYVNDRAIQETGYTKEELIGRNPRVLKSGNKDELFYKEMHEVLSRGGKWEGDFINKRKDGTEFYEKASIIPIFKHGEITNYLAIKINITDYIKEKEKVQQLAYYDSLTSLPNRLNMENYLRLLLVKARRENFSIAVLFIDLDHFKNVNDTLGHHVGDELLIECANKLKSVLRESDTVARIGGDEFVVIIENLEDNYYASVVARKILDEFREPILTTNHTLNITLSIGISIFPNDADECSALFKYADTAMYEAKEQGRNSFQFYEKNLSIELENRLDMEKYLKSALENNEIYLMYQPQYNIKDKTTVGLEALARWESKTLGFISPDVFIAIAEETGYILELGLFIFKQACKDFIIFKNECDKLKTISINISAVQLYKENFIDEIKSIVKECNLNTSEIILEITESHVMKNITQAMNILNKLKDAGFKLSIDDFGTGYSSLSYLKKFPIDELKIDKTFVDELPDDENDVAITRSIIALSTSMGYVNVAEGIETKEQEAFLEENDCEIGQGYYYSKPKKKDDLIKFLNR